MSQRAKPAAKPARRRKSQAPQLLACGVILLVAWALWRRGQPERLPGTLPQTERFNTVQTIFRGMLYRTTSINLPGAPGPRIICRSVYGDERILVEEDAKYRFANYPARMSAEEGAIYYSVTRNSTPAQTGGLMGITAQAPTVGSATSAAPRAPAGPGGGPVPRRPVNSPPDPILFRQVPAAGGPAKECAVIQSTSTMLVGSHVFWSRPRPTAPLVGVADRSETKGAQPRGELMLTDLKTGRETHIATTAHPVVNWYPGRDGVFWMNPRSGRERGVDLFYAQASTGKVLRLGALSQGRTIGWSLEFQGWLYWFVHVDPYPIPDATAQDTLMAASLDGSGVRETLRLNRPRIQAAFGQNLGTAGRSLVCLIRNTPADTSQLDYLQVARVRLGKSPSLETLWSLPPDTAATVGFDDGFLYYYVSEPQRTSWQVLTDDSPSAPRSLVFYRAPLQ